LVSPFNIFEDEYTSFCFRRVLLVGFYVSPSIVLGLIGIPIVFVIVFALKYLVLYIKESILEDKKFKVNK